MGASISTNTVNSMVQSGVNVYNQYLQSCSISGNDVNNIIVLGTGCTVSGSTLIINSDFYVSNNCMTQSTTKNSIQQGISQAINQSAQAVVQQFSFGTVADAQNFLNLSTQLSDSIYQAYTQQCDITKTNSTNTIDCAGGTINNSIIEINSVANISQQCILTVNNVNNVKTQLVQALQQSSVAKQADTFAAIMGLFLLGLLIVAGFTIYAADSPAVYIPVIILVLFFVASSVYYSVTASQKGNYPYKKT